MPIRELFRTGRVTKRPGLGKVGQSGHRAAKLSRAMLLLPVRGRHGGGHGARDKRGFLPSSWPFTNRAGSYPTKGSHYTAVGSTPPPTDPIKGAAPAQ